PNTPIRNKPEPIKHKHELDHALPTVIHDPEHDMPVLARWVRHAMEDRVRFFGLVAAVVVVVGGLSLLASGSSLGGASSAGAGIRLGAAKTAGERVDVAKDSPKTPAERWALLQAATEYYNQGFTDLPANQEVAKPTLKKALDLFQKVADEAPKDS